MPVDGFRTTAETLIAEGRRPFAVPFAAQWDKTEEHLEVLGRELENDPEFRAMFLTSDEPEVVEVAEVVEDDEED